MEVGDYQSYLVDTPDPSSPLVQTALQDEAREVPTAPEAERLAAASCLSFNAGFVALAFQYLDVLPPPQPTEVVAPALRRCLTEPQRWLDCEGTA